MRRQDRVPGPRGLPVVGSGVSLLRHGLAFGQRCADEYGDVVRVRLLGREVYALFHPDHVERVLVTDADSFVRSSMTTRALQDFEPDALLLADGERWRAMRQALQPAFFAENVAGYADAMGRVTADGVEEWTDGQRLDAHEVSRSLTARILSHTLFGADLREGGRERTIRRAARALRERFDTGSPSAFLPDWVPTPRIRRYRAASAELDALVEDLVTERRENPEDHDDLLAALVRRSEDVDALDESALRDNAKGLLIAGHDTSAVALAATLGLLALNSPVQRRVRSETTDAATSAPGAGALGSLEYTDAVVRETLRLYPPGPGIFRETATPVTVDGYRIPAGATVVVTPWVTHRDDRWFDDPTAFRPARWLAGEPTRTRGDRGPDAGPGSGAGPGSDANPTPRAERDGAGDDRPEDAYFPFGGGPRHCIGMRFAMAELKLAVATICQRVSLDTPMTEMPAMRGGMTLSPAAPIRVIVRR